MQTTKHEDHHAYKGSDKPADSTDRQPVESHGGEDRSAQNETNTTNQRPAPANSWTLREWIGLGFDGAVAVATVVGVVFLILQWNQTEEALNEAKEANRIARHATETSERIASEGNRAAFEAAKAAQDANAITINAMQLDERPWMLMTTVRMRELKQSDAEFGVDITIGNLGKSPATDVRMSAGMELRRELLSKNAPLPLGAPDIRAIGGEPGPFDVNQVSDLFPPTANRTISLTRPMDIMQCASLVHPIGHVWVAGRITYKDIFSKDHSTGFCYVSELAHGEGITFRFRPCLTGNWAK